MKPKVLKQKCTRMTRNHSILLDVPDHASGTLKGALMHAGTLASALILLSVLAAATSHALPQNGSVAGGSATISQPNSTTMNINQASGTAVINWQGYSIGANESVKYIQPGSSSIALNRVTGVDPSYIYGLLSGNGQVWVINPNGLLVGPGATIQTGSFLASTMNITNENFMSGKYNFTGTPDSQASIINQGHIQAANGGYVVLAAPTVTNSGSIVANVGTVHLASGDAVTLSIDNGNLINAAVSGDVAATALGVTNTGHITADGGRVLLTARVAGDIMKNVVNNEGIIEAKSIIEKDGIITLDGGDHGITANSGTLDASGKNHGETGGKVTVIGDKVGLFAGSAVDVSGDTGGGTVLIGGNFHGAGPERNASMTYVDKDASIKADARSTGDGGTVVVWSDKSTQFAGNISALGGANFGNGGFVETSGKQYLNFLGSVNTLAPAGKAGTLLLDPSDITITTAASSASMSGSSPFQDGAITTSNLQNTVLTGALAGGNVLVDATVAGVGGGSGSITVSAPITWANSNMLTLSAASTISVNAPINGGSTSSLTLNAGGTISQNAAGVITTGTLNTTSIGDTALNTATNAVNTFIASSSGEIRLTNIVPTLSLGAISGTGATINTTGNLSLTGAMITGGAASSLTLIAGGTISQNATGVITTGTLNTTANGGTALNAATNAVNTFIASDSGGPISLTNKVPTLRLGTISGTGATINTTGNLSLTDAIDVGVGNLDLTFGENVLETRTLDLSAAGALTAGAITATASSGTTKTIIITDNTPTLTLSNFSYAGTKPITLSNINNAIITGGASTNDINVSGWNLGRTASINVTAGAYTVTGNGVNTTLIGSNTASMFTISGSNSGVVNGTTNFSAVGNLTGGTGPDIFILDPGVTFRGSIVGGGGIDRLAVTNGANAWQVTGLKAGKLNTDTIFSGITNLSGGSGTDTLTGMPGGNSWAITGANAVTVSGMNGTSMDALVGGAGADVFTLGTGVPTFNGSITGGGTATLAVTNGTNAWQVTASKAGKLNTTTTFSEITNLSGGTGTDTLTGMPGGNSWAITGPKVVTVSGMNGTSMDALVGGPGADFFILGTGVPTFNGSIAGGGGTDTLAVTNGTNAWQVTGANAGRLNSTTTFTGISNLSGGSDTDTLTGVAGGGSWSITGGKTVTVSGMDGTSMDALIGGSGADIFTLAPGVTTFNGSIAGGGGTDTLAVTDGTNVWKSTGTNAGTLNTTTTFSAITNLNGSGTDTLTGANSVNAWSITGANAVMLDGMNATGINALVGGSGADTFTLASGLLNFNGSITGGGGTDTLAATNGINAWHVTGPNTGTLNTTTPFSGIANLAGGVGIDTLTAAGQIYMLDNSTANKGSNGMVAWTSIENLTDTGTGIFNMGTGGSVTGNLDGGSGGTLNYGSYTNPVTLNLAGIGTTGITTGTWSHITSVTGNAATSNTVIGSNKTYLLDNSTANKGSNGGVTWTEFKNITDTGTGIFNMGIGGSVTGNLDGGIGGTLNYSSYTIPVTLNLAGTGTTGITTGTWSGITTVTGSSNNDTISGTGKTYNLTALGVGNSGGVSWSSFEKIADAGVGTIATTDGRTYNLTGANSGNVTGLLLGGYTGIGNLTDSGAATFMIGSTGSITGNISAVDGSLNYSGGTGPATVNLKAKTGTGIGGTWSGITALTGSGGSSDTIGGANTTYNLTAANAGNSGGVSWTSFEKIADTGMGTIETTGGQTYNLTGANIGSVAVLLPGGYSGIANLADSGVSTFNFAAGGAVTGNITAAGGVLDYSAGIAGPVTVDLTAKTGSGIGGTWNGITTVIGSGASDTMGGASATYNLTALNAGNSGGISWTSFENLHDTAAGIFRFAAGGAVTGGITATGGTLDYSGIAGPVTIDLTAKTGSGIGGTWDGITTVTGSGASDTMGGTNTVYNLTAANAGNSGGVSWSSFEKIADAGSGTIATTGAQTYHLTGSNSGTVASLLPDGYTGIGNLSDSGASTFHFASGGSVTGNITAAGGVLDYSAGIAGPVTVDLTAKTGSGIGGTWDGITTVIGSGASDTMGGTNATYHLTALNAGNSNGVSWTSFEKIADAGAGTIATTGGQTYNLTGSNSGSVAALLSGGYSGTGNLADTSASRFAFAAGGSVTGDITAAGGVLDYSAGIAGPVTVNLTTKTGSGIGGTWNGITTVTGSGASDTMGGANATYNLASANAGNSGGISWTSFENLHDTAAGIFWFAAAGTVAGTITAAGGTLDYSGLTGPITVDLTEKTAPGIGGTWNGIANVTGTTNITDTITGSGQTFNLTGADAGNNGSVSWSSFENINGLAGTNSYVGSGGSLSGTIIDSGTVATLQGSIQTGGAQSYNGAVTLGAATTLTSTGSGAITFAGTLDSDFTPRDLTVGTSGVITFGGAVGTTPLNSLTINAGGTTKINGGSITTSGAGGQAYYNAVVLGPDTLLNSGSGAITEGTSGSLTTAGLLTTRSGSGQNLVGNGTNTIASFNATNTTSGDINLTNTSTPLTITGITQTGGGLIITNNGEITSSGPLTVTGTTSISAVGQPVTLTNANNDFGGTVTVSGATTQINDKNNLAVDLNTTGPATLTAGADMKLSGTSTDSVSATAVGNVTLSNPAASILHITGATIVGTMSNSTPLDLTTTNSLAPITVNLTGSLPFLTFASDVRTQIRNLGLYNGAVVMGSGMDHFKSTIDSVRASITTLAAHVELLKSMGMLARFDEFFTVAPKESLINSEGAFIAPESEPKLVDF